MFKKISFWKLSTEMPEKPNVITLSDVLVNIIKIKAEQKGGHLIMGKQLYEKNK